ncbi:MAG: DUF882 domain-containing protein [Pseudomonadota bacterium]
MRATVASTILFILTALFVTAVSAPLESAVERPSPFKYSGDGCLSLIDVHTGEAISVVYRDKRGQYQDSALEAIDHTLRCHGSGQELPISLKLIELVDHIQDHFDTDQIKVVSGYRSFAYNSSLRRRLRRVAHDSLHIQGMAMDINLPRVHKGELGLFARALKAGGVGVYRSSTFVHVDVGPVRNW